MVDVFDVAQYILQERSSMTTMKLQKLVYFCQAWSLVWDEEPLFNQEIEAWASGPVVRELYDAHKGKFELSSLNRGEPEHLSQGQKDTIDAVLEYYGNQSAQWLSDLTHIEEPWGSARTGIPDGVPCTNEISHASMHEYYSSLPPDTQ